MLKLIPILLLSVLLNLFQWQSNGDLKRSVRKLEKVDEATDVALTFKCKEDTKTTETVTKYIKDIEYVEIPKEVEPNTPMPPDFKRLLDEAYEDLFPNGETMSSN